MGALRRHGRFCGADGWVAGAERQRGGPGLVPVVGEPAPQPRRGRLAQDKVEALGKVGEWVGTRKGEPEELWARRLEQVQQFREEAGRFPVYDPQRHPDEKVLAVWLGRQRTWQRKGRLRTDRQETLTQLLPHWDAPATSR